MRLKSDVCREGHRAIVERKGRRFCKVCANERSKRWQRDLRVQHKIRDLTAKRHEALAKVRQMTEDGEEPAVRLLDYIQRAEDTIERLESGQALGPQPRRKRVEKVRFGDERLCERCMRRVFPKPGEPPVPEPPQ
jgi:hypothetical protein